MKTKLAEWEHFYNYSRPHSSFNGKTPYERFLELKDKVPNQWDIFEKYWKSNEQVKDYKMEKYKKQNPEIAKILDVLKHHKL